MRSRRLQNLKKDILLLLKTPSTTNQILNQIKKQEDYKFISWSAVNTRLTELESEKKIKVNGAGRTKVYYK